MERNIDSRPKATYGYMMKGGSLEEERYKSMENRNSEIKRG